MKKLSSTLALLLCTHLVAPLSAQPTDGKDEQGEQADGASGIPIADVSHEGPVDFEKDILPILRRNCLACHNRSDAENDLVLETPQAILAGGSEGPAVIPEDSSKSLLLQVAAQQSEPYMPPKDNKVGAQKLTSGQLGLLKLWIDQGARGEVADTAGPIDWHPLPPGFHPIYATAISPPGDYVAAGRANQIFVYHLPTKQLVGRLTDPALLEEGVLEKPGVAHRAIVQSLVFSPDGTLLASGGYGNIKLWRLQQDPPQWKLERMIGGAEAPGALVGRVTSLSFHPDGKRLAAGGGQPSRSGQLTIWNTDDGQLVREIENPHSDAVFGTAFSPDGKLLASCGADRMMSVFDAQTGERQKMFQGHTHHVLGVSWQAEGQLLATCGADKIIKVWNYQTGSETKGIGGFSKEVTSIHFMGTSNKFIVSTGDPAVTIRNTDGASGTTFEGNHDYVYCVRSSADGQTVVAGGLDSVVRVWRDNGELIASFDPPGQPPSDAAPTDEQEAN